jgi:hypothetical protein
MMAPCASKAFFNDGDPAGLDSTTDFDKGKAGTPLGVAGDVARALGLLSEWESSAGPLMNGPDPAYSMAVPQTRILGPRSQSSSHPGRRSEEAATVDAIGRAEKLSGKAVPAACRPPFPSRLRFRALFRPAGSG